MVASRVAELLARLTLAEKIGLLHQHQAAVPRLGIAPFRTGTEALHGLAWLGPATVFPQALGLASTWNPELVRAVGTAVGEETRGFHHKDGAAATPTGTSLNVWAPVVNPLRDPRWGRNEEGYAEDPLLTAELAVAYAGGLRGDHPEYLRTAPTLKHFLAYNNETRRDQTSSNLPPRVLREYELPAYRAPIAQGAAVAVMGSYNLVNGRPAHLSPLLNEELRRWTDDEVLVVSDAMAPSNVVSVQGYYPDHAASYAALLRAGVDSFTDGDARSGETVDRVGEALRRGLLDESDVDLAVTRILATRFRLGEFDPPAGNPYAGITEEVINCPAHQALAREAARQAIVLLKNDHETLPLDTGRISRIAVVGPNADTLYEDWYSGTLPYAVTVRQGVAERLAPDTKVDFAEGVDRIALRLPAGGYLSASERPDGAVMATAPTAEPGATFDLFDWGQQVCALRSVANGRFVTVDDDGVLRNAAAQPNGWVVRETFALEAGDGTWFLRHLATGRYVAADGTGPPRAEATTRAEATAFQVELISSGVDQAVTAATGADLALVVVGNHPLINGRETEDRTDLALPPAQEALVRAVHAANPRTVLLITSSYPYAIGWAQQHLPAILWSAHGGQEYGHAVADVLVGDSAPAGRLTQTWYRSAAHLPDLLDYDIIGADATYLYYRGAPLYPFGHGLSYAPIGYLDPRVPAGRFGPADEVPISVDVTNPGDHDTDEVVQVYTRQHRSRVKQPLRQLRAFQRVRVPAGGRTTVRFTLRVADLAFWDVTRERYTVESARHDVLFGRSATDIRQFATIDVEGESVPPRDPYRTIPAVNADQFADVDLVDAALAAGDAVLSTTAGAWIAFDGVDLTGRIAGCTARLSGERPGPATVRLVLDDPLDGPVIATLTASGTGDRRDWATVAARVTGAPAGVRDVFAVFESAGVALRELTFSGDGPA